MEWADQYRVLSPESSSVPGRWKTTNVEAARGPMLAVTDPRVKKITVMGPTQLLKTELINNIVGYFISQDPAPMIVMQPTGKMAEAWSKDRLDKMIRDTPILQGLVKDKKSRDSDNTILHKSFPGGHITMVGSNSPADLASRPVRVVLCDEVDKYPDSSGKEGDPVRLIEERTDTFWNALVVTVCSPTIKDRSRIEADYEASDKRKFHGKCPHCGKYELLSWKQVKWDKADPEGTAYYQCSQCGVKWTEMDRLAAISGGTYIATAPFRGHAGFHCNKIASPWQPLSVLVRKWTESQGDAQKLKTFVNTQLAETWEEEGEVPEAERLYERRETWANNSIQKNAVFLTAAIDVQKGRFEVEIVAWGRDKQSWSVDYRVIPADTANEEDYKKLDPLLNETWIAPDGRQLLIQMLAIDSGYNTQEVYSWGRRQSPDRVRIIDGRDKLQTLIGTPSDIEIMRDGRKSRTSVKLWPVGVDVAKSQLYGWLQLPMPEDGKPYPPGYCHFPQYDLEHFRRLTAETLMKRTSEGKTVYKWVQTHERNEQLDIRVYNRAAASMFGMDRFSDEDWDVLEGEYDVPKARAEESATAREREAESPDPRNDFWSRQRGKKLF